MKLQIEIAGLVIGLIGSGVLLIVISLWGELPINFREFFRGGNLGAQVMGAFLIIGFFSGFLMCFNFIVGLRKHLLLRLLGFISFLLLTVSFAASV